MTIRSEITATIRSEITATKKSSFDTYSFESKE